MAKEDEKQQVVVKLNEASWVDASGSNKELPGLKLIDERGKAAELLKSEQGTKEVKYTYEVEQGKYQYIVYGSSDRTFGGGTLKIEAETSEIYLHSMILNLSYGPDLDEMSVSVIHQDGSAYNSGNVM